MNKTKFKSEINKMKTQWKIVCFTIARPPAPPFDTNPPSPATSTDDKFKSLYLSVTAVEIKHVA